MWDEIEKYLPMFESAVLNVADAEGYPYSVRRHPEPDRAAGVLRLEHTRDYGLRPGPASLLCHSHDENTWNQKIFVLRGSLEQDEDGWAFRPERFVPSIGTGSSLDAVRALMGMRRSTRSYLERRGMTRPRIPWAEIDAVKERAARSASAGTISSPAARG